MEYIMFGLGMVTGAGWMFIYKCGCDSNRVRDNVRQGTQAYLVREHLEHGLGIDAKHARDELGIKNLTSVVDKLRKAGVKVKTIENSNGNYYTL